MRLLAATLAVLALLFSAGSAWAETERKTIAKATRALHDARFVAHVANDAAARARDAAEKARNLPTSKQKELTHENSKYVGEVRNGDANGFGVHYHASGNRYEGEYRGNKFNGYGVYYFASGSRYEGENRHSDMNGPGVYYFANGSRYEGENRDGKFIGPGVYYWNNGNRYEGEYRDSKRNGYGVLFFANGEAHYAYWENDRPDPKRLAIRTGVEAPVVAKAEPVRITTIDESYTTRGNANVMKAPDTSSRRITSLQKGSRIQVTGKVKGKNWYAVERVGKHLGYVHADLLEPYEPSRDQSAPEIMIAGSFEAEAENFTLRGRVLDESSIDRVEILGRKVKLSSDGSFKVGVYIPHRGKIVDIIATDIHGNRASKTVSIARVVEKTGRPKRLAELDPTNIKASENDNSIALVIGIGDYEVAPDAPYADLDAEYFSDYVHRALGVPRSNIQLLIDKDANRLSMKRAIKRWLPGLIRKDTTDVYVFFAGHGLASKDGKDLYLLPENGLPDLLEDSAIMRNEIYDALTEADPRSVTVFLDTCFSGGTRGNAMLVADARNILVTARDSPTPDRFTVFTASAADEISSSLPEAEHGLFSYFLMKGMEGDADANGDREITAGELHAYVSDHVSRQALRLGRVQTPQLQGNGGRVLVKW